MKEIWKKIPLRDLRKYEISSLGRVRRACDGTGTHAGKMRKMHTYADGYVRLVQNVRRDGRWKSRTFLLHGLMALTFIGKRPKKMEVDHADKIRSHNVLENLSYKTRIENAARGEDFGFLTEKDVIEMRKSKERNCDVARRLGVSQASISAIRNYKIWKHVA